MLSINGNFLVVFVVIWLTVFLLKRLFFNPVERIREKRESTLNEQREAWEKAAKEAETLAQRIESELRAAREEAAAYRQALEDEALLARNELLARMQGQHRQQLAEARQEITQITAELKKKLESEMEALAAKIEERLLN